MNAPVTVPLTSITRRPRRDIDPVRLREVDQMLADAGFDLGDDGPAGAKLGLRRDLLIEYLHAINDRCKQLWKPHLAALAKRMRLSLAEVFEVASFYHHFRVVGDVNDETPPTAPRAIVRVCNGLSCEMRGAKNLREEIAASVGDDVLVLDAPCVGRCDTAPAVTVDQHELLVGGSIGASDVIHVLSQNNQNHSLAQTKRPARAKADYAVLRECVSGARDVESVISTLETSGLRGLGGAGFPAGRKWRIVKNEAAPRLMAVNIDEGEPGTFKDRHYLETHPHQFIEGMLIAAWAVGIDAIYVYLRDEYHAIRAELTQLLNELKANPPIDSSVWRLPRIELRRGAGAYICGEESAMIESIEGKRGMPRLRPPYVAQVGLFGRPTLEHNMETLYWVPALLAKGADWFLSHGANGRKGLRSFSVSGRVKQPGVKLAPAGITLQALIDEYCGGMEDGHTLYGYLPGGASGGILPASLANVPLDFDTLQPHGCFIGSAAVIVLSETDRAADAARNMMSFFAHENCGQCTPCRAGTVKARELIESDAWDRELLADLSQVLRDASICGLGQAAPNPIDCVVKYFPHELTDAGVTK
ncbi:MAG: NADH-quinone oxidoreductase subunit F [Betaproteobacteria bacterium]|nr:MAG: NADH-quinone oxidoreductase subunit F [Betaproteobacteria bacterium]